jgi:peptidoglycan/LPS O-acetylase OafA/YrhL
MEIKVNRINFLIRGSKASRYLDLLRGISAIYVMIFHLRPQLFVGSEKVIDSNIGLKTLYLITSLGYQFVMVFFVLSGYLISTSVIRSIQQNRWSWKEYMTNRLIRLWIVLLPALILTYVWDMSSIVLFNNDSSFGGSLSWQNFLGNAFFLQGIFFENFGSNGPLWSLSYEFWYYLLFPCLAHIFLSKSKKKKALYFLMTIAICLFVGKTIILYFIIWLLGSLLGLIPLFHMKKKTARFFTLSAVLCVTGISMIGVKVLELYIFKSAVPNLLHQFPYQFIIGFSFALLLYALLSFYNRSEEKVETKSRQSFSWWIASFSYSLYLTHWPVILFYRSWFGYQSWQPDLRHLLYGSIIAVAITFYAWLVSLLTETNTSRIKAYLIRFIDDKLNKRHNKRKMLQHIVIKGSGQKNI